MLKAIAMSLKDAEQTKASHDKAGAAVEAEEESIQPVRASGNPSSSAPSSTAAATPKSTTASSRTSSERRAKTKKKTPTPSATQTQVKTVDDVRIVLCVCSVVSSYSVVCVV